MGPQVTLKINDPMKPPEERSCCKAIAYIFCGRKVKKIKAQDSTLVASLGRVDIGEIKK